MELSLGYYPHRKLQPHSLIQRKRCIMDNNKHPGIITFPLAKRKKTTRTSSPKVRTGCLTCKKRRVKCDEAKPGCTRCIKFKGHCEGYEHLVEEKEKSVESSPPSKSRQETPSSLSPPQLFPSPKIAESSRREPYQVQQSSNRGQEDEGDIGLFTRDFWEREATPMFRNSAAMRFAARALQTLIKAEKPETKSKGKSTTPTLYGRSLGYIGDALYELRRSALRNGELKAAIMCSLIFVIFETMNDDLAAARSHLSNGQNMMEALRQDHLQLTPTMMNSHPSAELKQVLYRLAQDSWVSRAAQPALDDQQLQAVVNLESGLGHQMPAVFQSEGEANLWFAAIQRHIIRRINPSVQWSPLLGTQGRVEVKETEEEEQDVWYRLLSWITAWRDAAEPIVRASQDLTGNVRHCMLRTLMMYLANKSCIVENIKSEEVTIALEKTYREIVELSETLTGRTTLLVDPHCSRCTGNGSAFPLLLVASRTLDNVLREKVLRLIGAHPFCPGAWYEIHLEDEDSELNKPLIPEAHEHAESVLGSLSSEWETTSLLLQTTFDNMAQTIDREGLELVEDITMNAESDNKQLGIH